MQDMDLEIQHKLLRQIKMINTEKINLIYLLEVCSSSVEHKNKCWFSMFSLDCHHMP